MADLYPEIEARMTEFGERQRRQRTLRLAFDRWREKRPWPWLPARVQGVVWSRFVVRGSDG